MRTSRTFAIEPGGARRVEISWSGAFNAMRVAFDGADCGALDKKKVTANGDRLPLPDGSKLFVRSRGLLGLELRRDDVAIPGSDLEPKRLLRNASLLLAVLGALDLAADLVRWRRGESVTPLLGMDGALLVIAVATFFGQRMALALGIAAFVAHVGMLSERSTWTLIFAVVATWLLGNHFFAAGAAPSRRSP